MLGILLVEDHLDEKVAIHHLVQKGEYGKDLLQMEVQLLDGKVGVGNQLIDLEEHVLGILQIDGMAGLHHESDQVDHHCDLNRKGMDHQVELVAQFDEHMEPSIYLLHVFVFLTGQIHLTLQLMVPNLIDIQELGILHQQPEEVGMMGLGLDSFEMFGLGFGPREAVEREDLVCLKILDLKVLLNKVEQED